MSGAAAGWVSRTVAARDVPEYLRREWRSVVWLVPVALAISYAVIVLVDFRTIIASINRNSDAVIAPVLAKLWGEAPAGSHALLGNHAWYEEFLILRATSGLPFYREIWEVLPAAWSFGALAILVWAMRRAFGTRSALIAAAALLCVGQLGRFMLFSFNWHGLAVVHTVILGAALLFVVQRGRGWSWLALVALGLAVGGLSAFPTASDPGFPYWALAPLLGTAAVVAWKGDRPAARAAIVFSLTTTIVALVGAAILTSAMQNHGVDARPLNTTFVPPDRIVPNLVLLVEGFTALAGGHFFGSELDFDGATVFISGALLLTALAVTLRLAWPFADGAVRRIVASPTRGADAVTDRLVHVIFWALALIAATVVFVLNSAPVDVMSARFLLTGYVAIGALLPVLMAREVWLRAVVGAGIALFALVASYQVARQPDIGDNFPTAAQANALVRFAAQHGARYGYADFWDAANLTWQSRFKVRLFPTETCGDHLCPHSLVQIDSWYPERPGTRSMLVVDENQPGLQPPGPQLGKPVAGERAGALTFYVYPYDLASRIHG